MKILIVLLLSISLVMAMITGCGAVLNRSAQSDISGTWNGEVKSGTGDVQRGVMIINKKSDGTFSGLLVKAGDSMSDTPVDVITLSEDKIHFEVHDFNGIFEGVVEENGTIITGEWLISGVKFIVVMKKE